MPSKQETLLTSIEAANSALKAGQISVIILDQGQPKPLVEKSFDDTFKYLTYAELAADEEFKKVGISGITKIVVKNSEKKDINCIIVPVTHENRALIHIILQSKAPFELNADYASGFICQLSSAIVDHVYDVVHIDVSDKNKKELMNLRHIQAMLFPKFEAINGYDIGNVLMPSQTMSGNFVDGYQLNDDIFQVAACVITGHDSTAPFVGSAVRTMIRSASSPNIMPSSLIEILNNKLTKMVSGIHYLVNINIFQLSIKTGKVTMSAYGPLTVLLYNAQKKGALNLGDTAIGKDLAKHASFKDLSFNLTPGDALLYYTNSITSAESEDGKAQFGYSSLWDKFVKFIDLPATEHVHAITETMFEFINYAPIKEDVMMVKIKKL